MGQEELMGYQPAARPNRVPKTPSAPRGSKTPSVPRVSKTPSVPRRKGTFTDLRHARCHWACGSCSIQSSQGLGFPVGGECEVLMGRQPAQVPRSFESPAGCSTTCRETPHGHLPQGPLDTGLPRCQGFGNAPRGSGALALGQEGFSSKGLWGGESPAAPVLLGVDCLFLTLGVPQCPARHKQRVVKPLFEPKLREEKESRALGLNLAHWEAYVSIFFSK